MKRNVGCPCGRNFQADADEEINLDNNPEFIEKILDGTFMSFTCPGCGKKHKPEFSVILVWKSKNHKLEILPELERGEFYRRKKDNSGIDTIIGYPEMADRIAVIRDDLQPVVIETLKYYLLAKAEETYPDREINAWYHGKDEAGIEFHLDGIKAGEMAVMKVPQELYEKTCEKYRKQKNDEIFSALHCRSYMSVQNIYRPDAFK
ncbi:MAG: CpXC domain-containing protein [Treponema sp.]|jgi:hypothetical protein|nr:CpXC domain-containing protein [Treponema sp.]